MTGLTRAVGIADVRIEVVEGQRAGVSAVTMGEDVRLCEGETALIFPIVSPCKTQAASQTLKPVVGM